MAEVQDVRCARRVIYHGRVQGVGFRATTAQIAREFPVTGLVRNLSDGTVELLVQGSQMGVEDFLTKVASQFRANIVQIDELNTIQPIVCKGFTVQE